MTDTRRDLALAIKHCLDSLAMDAEQADLGELAHFIGIAAAAAEDAARLADPSGAHIDDLMRNGPFDHC